MGGVELLDQVIPTYNMQGKTVSEIVEEGIL